METDSFKEYTSELNCDIYLIVLEMSGSCLECGPCSFYHNPFLQLVSLKTSLSVGIICKG